jgi:hypothetical protein
MNSSLVAIARLAEVKRAAHLGPDLVRNWRALSRDCLALHDRAHLDLNRFAPLGLPSELRELAFERARLALFFEPVPFLS